MPPPKKLRPSSPQRYNDGSASPGPDMLSDLPDDVLLLILARVSAKASSPSDFVNVLETCKRINRLAMTPAVLRELSGEAMAVKAGKWSESAHRFLRRCVQSGNVEAHYVLGMIRFYCLGDRATGASLMAKAGMRNHAPSLYSLALIHFNGSGKSKDEKDLKAGVALCARAAFLGSTVALRELGHCVTDGHGVRRDSLHGRRLILQASLYELQGSKVLGSVAALHLPDPAHRYLREFFESTGDVSQRLCSNEACGRAETRENEFRLCSVCGTVSYCSRVCQSLDWRYGHKDVCIPNLGDAVEVEGEGVDVNIDGGVNMGLI